MRGSVLKKGIGAVPMLGHLILVAPVFLLYHIGLLVSPRSANGVDPITRLLGLVVGWSATAYLAIMAGFILIYGLVVWYLRKKGRFDPRWFSWVLLESGCYALIMGPLTNLLLDQMHLLGRAIEKMGPLDRVVASAGAGFYEELVFRLAGLSLLLWMSGQHNMRRGLAVPLAVFLTSFVFSLVHYVGPGADVFTSASFAFRLVLGVFLSTIFLSRGFSTAVYTHFLYDVYVMCVLMK